VAVVHGEQDHQIGNTGYEANLVQFQGDYDTDVKVITGQTGVIPMMLCQMHSWTKYASTTSLIPLAQLAAAKNNPTKIFLVTPKYIFNYQTDGIHLTAADEKLLGQYYAKALASILSGAGWKPLWPISATRSGSVITIVFNVPKGDLALDTSLVVNPGNYGFEYTDASGSPPAISSVQVTARDTVKINLASTPSGSSKKVRYAFTGVSGNNAGRLTGARGCLRDSDGNYCVTFSEDLT
jgi:hypothetical protein